MLMASGDSGQKFTAGEVADEINASRAHVSKVVTKLAELGFIRAQKGRYGGIYFEESALERSVGGLLRILETGEVVDCEGTSCPMVPGCKLRGALAQAKEAFFQSLDPVLVRDLVSSGSGAPQGADFHDANPGSVNAPGANGHRLLPISPVFH